MVRAQESQRDDRLFNDPYAEAFLIASPGAFDAEQRAAEAGAGDMAPWGAAFWSHAVTRTTTCLMPQPTGSARWCYSPPAWIPAPTVCPGPVACVCTSWTFL